MRVLFNALVASGRKTGVGYYAGELARCLARQMGDDRLEVFPGSCLRTAFALCARLRPYLERKNKGPAAPSHVAGPSLPTRALGWLRDSGQALLARRLQARCARGCDVYHEPNYIPLPAEAPAVVTVHDLSVLLHPEWHPADRVAHYERHFVGAVPRVAHFVTVSDFTRQELIRSLNVPPERVTRTHLGVRPGLRPLPAAEVAATLARLGLPPRYLLYLGTLEPRKNLPFLLKAYCALPEAVRSRWPLLLVGSWGWNTGPLSAFFETEARHRGVIQVGYVAEQHIAAVYNGARALVYPSLYEGFGLPPVEMMACGGAVLASTAGAVAEAVGRKAHLLPPDDLGGWRDAMVRVVEDEGWWRGLQQGTAELAAGYTWERCAAETLAVYRRVAGGPAEEKRAA